METEQRPIVEIILTDNPDVRFQLAGSIQLDSAGNFVESVIESLKRGEFSIAVSANWKQKGN